LEILPNMRIPVLPAIFLYLFVSCTNNSVCDEVNSSELVARFKTVESGISNDTVISGVTMYGIRDGKPDSLLIDSLTLSRIVLPLDSHHKFSRFVVSINEKRDTVKIVHSTDYVMTSYACGFASVFTINSLIFSKRMIDTIEIIDAIVDTEPDQNEEHLWIYF